MKKLLVGFSMLISISTFANDHIVYSKVAKRMADNDACIGVAVEAIIDRVMIKWMTHPI